ncbi:atypical chemokine receptor 3-like [Mercenaria mercenaria]|uniref:atypical chemokine receptor 3-like n=1 Tax=Mercenaria mercenaria TaxID=6596 RepID=UPI001E1D6D85|nr:atypical chemokine receptor 3-like [Mercenaria mercenaria]XP_045174296.1 atypical chemokine receptor 3-like [Mercenaria mercenaria]XP_045174299.1 atypical chemokine receptor 3-like [Mercenaria mercenaria]XP_053385045.1 atypical chemokine receptor 3-like [Mercenaria mercenaria]XP_053385046.1 atypical chemokine receptor 3-like [Mercenaria mercenaria]XP_053385047.1 atypical chemokine receptor 3-like [Mercenaria mercenaria]XP_053385048.1 atypical chemokine receptor 3-like [Mercenaria mercenari
MRIMDQNETTTGYAEEVAIDVLNVLVLIVSVTGMFLNTTTILALVHLPWSSRPNLRLILSLCVANFLFALNFLIYMLAFYSNPIGSGYAVTCLMFEVLRCVLYLYIYFNLASIVLDLCLAVTNPLGYASIVTKGRTNKLLFINAFISLVIMALAITFNYLTLTEATNVHTHESSCSIYPNYVYIRSFNWIFKVSVFICIPVFIVLLTIIFLAVKATTSSSNSQPSNTRGVITVMLVIFTFLVCFAPYQFISFYIQYSPESYQHFSTLAQILERLLYLNGFFVPLLYSLRTQDVRKGYTLMFKKCVSAASDYQSVFTGE